MIEAYLWFVGGICAWHAVAGLRRLLTAAKKKDDDNG